MLDARPAFSAIPEQYRKFAVAVAVSKDKESLALQFERKTGLSSEKLLSAAAMLH